LHFYATRLIAIIDHRAEVVAADRESRRLFERSVLFSRRNCRVIPAGGFVFARSSPAVRDPRDPGCIFLAYENRTSRYSDRKRGRPVAISPSVTAK